MDDAAARLLQSWRSVPAIARDRYLNVVAANRAAVGLCPALEPGHNLARSAFLGGLPEDDDWRRLTSSIAGLLRDSLEEHEEDAGFIELVGELATRSTTFGRLWSEPGRDVDHVGVVVLSSKFVGELRMRYQELRMPLDDDITIVVLQAADGWSARRYDRLLHLLALA